MKFIKVFWIGTIAFSALFNKNSTHTVYGYENQDINLKGVILNNSITKKLYQLGFTNNEINNMSYEEYHLFDNLIIKESKQEITNVTNIIDNDGKFQTIQSTGKNIAQTRSTEVTNYQIADHKTITVTCSFLEEIAGEDLYFVKTTVDWITLPYYIRSTDVISINYSNNLSIMYHYLDGTNCPWFRSDIYYVETRYIKYNSSDNYSAIVDSRDVYYNYDGLDTNCYNNIIDEGIAVKIELPQKVISTEVYTDENGEYNIVTDQSEMEISLSAFFIPKNLIAGFPNQVTGTFVGAYAQNRLPDTNFDIGDITLSLNMPFISVSASLGGIFPEEYICGTSVQLTNIFEVNIAQC